MLCVLVALFALAACGGDGAGAAAPAGVAPPAVGAGGSGGGAAQPITFQMEPLDQQVADGGSAILAVSVSSAATPTYQWQRNGAPIAGATNALYVSPALSLADSGVQYAVVVSNASGAVTTRSATITVAPVAPSIADQPQPQTVALGQQATFTVNAHGSQPLSYQWQRDGVDIPGANAASFTAAAAGAGDAGSQWRVIVRNAGGAVTSSEALLQVSAAGPVVLRTLQFAVASPGQRVVISTTVGGNPPFTYQWLRNDQAIAGAAGTSDSGALQLVTPAMAAADDGVRISLTVSNAEGSTRSVDAVITVIGAAPVAAGGAHSLARSADGGTVWAWGDNRYGQLGLGTLSSSSTRSVIAGLSGVKALAAGADHSLALKDDGTVWAWGRNTDGALGDGTRTDRPVPQRVAGLDNVVAVAAAAGRSFALRADGSLWAWGENGTGALGVGSQNDALEPAQVGMGVAGFSRIVQVAAGARHTLALSAGGQVFTIGEVAVPLINRPNILPTPTAVEGLALVAGIAAGDGFSVALDIGGRLWSWGVNGSGQLGLGHTTPRALPVLIERTQAGAPLLPALRLAAGRDFALARLLDGSVVVWGAGGNGQLGAGTAGGAMLAPAAIATLPAPIDAVAGGRGHVLAVRADGSVYAWGANEAGQLGIGSSEALRAEPVQIPAFNLD